MLSRKYEVIRVACYKGVNECPDVFKYIILIEFIIVDGCDTHARDCMQRFRICRMSGRVNSLEQLSLAEFSGEKARPKVYENGHKNVLAIWLDLVSDSKIWEHFFKVC